MTTQPERTAAARAAIVAAAIDVLGSEGHRALTNTRLQEASGHSRGLVGYHFGSREKLLEAVVDSIRDDFIADLVRSPQVESLAGLQATVRLVDTYLRELVRDPRRNLATLVLTVASIREMPNLQTSIRRLNDGLRRGVGDLLARGLEDGSIRADTELAAAAVTIVSMLRGTTIQWLAVPDVVGVEVARREITNAIHRCYASRPS